MEVARLVCRRGLKRDQSKFVPHLVANWQPMQVDEDWSNVITPTAPSYDTSNRVLHSLQSAVSKRLLWISLTELTYSSQVYQRLLHFR